MRLLTSVLTVSHINTLSIISACIVHTQDLHFIRGSSRNRTAMPTALEELCDCGAAVHSNGIIEIDSIALFRDVRWNIF